jgi:hypothetical protein
MELGAAVDAVEKMVGVPLAGPDWHRLGTLCESLGVRFEASHAPPPAELAAAWRLFINRDGSFGPPSLAQVYGIGLLWQLTAPPAAGLAAAFAALGLRLEASRFEMMKRMAMRLYTIGRNSSVRGRDCAAGARLLSAAVRLFDDLERSDAVRSPAARRSLHGMRGVALILLSRSCADAGALRRARADLEVSHGLGDASPQNLCYRRECARRLYDCGRDPALLDLMETLLAQSEARDRQYYSDLARYHEDRAARALFEGEGDFAVHRAAGVAACDEVLRLWPGQDQENAIFYNVRGYLHYLAAGPALRGDRAAAVDALTRAVADFRVAGTYGLGGACLALALLRRAALLVEADPAAARADLAAVPEGLRLAEPETAARIRAQLDAALHDCALREAVQAGDPAGLLEGCEALLATGEEAQRHLPGLLDALRLCWTSDDGAPAPRLRRAAEQALTLCARAEGDEEGRDEKAALLRAAITGPPALRGEAPPPVGAPRAPPRRGRAPARATELSPG